MDWTQFGDGRGNHQDDRVLKKLNFKDKGVMRIKGFGYLGTVTEVWCFRNGNYLAHVEYDDGDREDTTLGELRWLLPQGETGGERSFEHSRYRLAEFVEEKFSQKGFFLRQEACLTPCV